MKTLKMRDGKILLINGKPIYSDAGICCCDDNAVQCQPGGYRLRTYWEVNATEGNDNTTNTNSAETTNVRQTEFDDETSFTGSSRFQQVFFDDTGAFARDYFVEEFNIEVSLPPFLPPDFSGDIEFTTTTTVTAVEPDYESNYLKLNTQGTGLPEESVSAPEMVIVHEESRSLAEATRGPQNSSDDGFLRVRSSVTYRFNARGNQFSNGLFRFFWMYELCE